MMQDNGNSELKEAFFHPMASAAHSIIFVHSSESGKFADGVL